MKKLILLIFLTFSNLLFSQEGDTNPEDYQKKLFTEGHAAMKNRDLTIAYNLFSQSQILGSNEEIKNKSRQKTDSLKLVFREKLKQKLVGNWKMLNVESWALREPSDSVVGKMITIDPNQILFYELYPKSKKWNLIKSEKLIFSEKLTMDFDPLLIVYFNKEVWSYNVDETSGELIAYYIGKENETEISEMVCGNTKIKYFKLQ